MKNFSHNIKELSKLPQMQTPINSTAKKAKNIEIAEFESLENFEDNFSNPEEPPKDKNINVEIPGNFSMN
jgi:hypothetical protein